MRPLALHERVRRGLFSDRQDRLQGVGGAVRAARAAGVLRRGGGPRARYRRRVRPLPALAPPRRARPVGADLARRAGPGPGHPRHRIRRGDERDPDDRGGVPGAQGAPDADGRVDHADASTADRGPRRLRGRVLPRVQGHDLRPPRAAGADLHRGADKAHTRFIVSDDPADVVDRIGPYLDLGFDDLVIHGPGGDQRRFLEQFTTDVLPALRERADRGIPAAATSASTA